MNLKSHLGASARWLTADVGVAAAAYGRTLLGALLAFGALNAFAGGYYGMSGAEGVPKEWLRGSAFTDYYVPGIILFVAVGGSLLVASIAVFRQLRYARFAAVGAGLIVLGWIVVQVS